MLEKSVVFLDFMYLNTSAVMFMLAVLHWLEYKLLVIIFTQTGWINELSKLFILCAGVFMYIQMCDGLPHTFVVM